MIKLKLTNKEAEMLKLICYNNAGYGGTKELSADEWFSIGDKIKKLQEDHA